MHIIKIATIAIIAALLASSCSKDEDDSSYATMTSEFCTLQTSDDKTCRKATTDKDVTLTFNTPLTVSWATTPDSTYRALLYYNKVDNSTSVQALAANIVHVLYPCTPEKAAKWINEHDPIDIAAAWRSSNNKWLNFNLSVKNGTTDSNTKTAHTLGAVCDSVVTTPSGRLIYCSLCHGQNGIPTYYTITAYVSIPIENPTDSFVINAVTWKGKVEKKY